MKRWQRRLFGILALGGGAAGFTVATQLLISHGRGVNFPILLVVIAIYAWGMWCGLMLIEGKPGVERFNRRYWLLQIPILSSPIASGYLWGGARLTVTVKAWPLDVNVSTGFGAGFEYSYFQRTDELALGVNLFAVVVAVWLQMVRERAEMLPADPGGADVPGTAVGTPTLEPVGAVSSEEPR